MCVCACVRVRACVSVAKRALRGGLYRTYTSPNRTPFPTPNITTLACISTSEIRRTPHCKQHLTLQIGNCQEVLHMHTAECYIEPRTIHMYTAEC